MKTKNKNLMTLEEFKEKNYGKHGTKERDELEAGYENFKIGALIHDARIEKGMTQEELAEKVGTTKSYISKIENNIKEARISTLQKIVELGFGGLRTIYKTVTYVLTKEKKPAYNRVGGPANGGMHLSQHPSANSKYQIPNTKQVPNSKYQTTPTPTLTPTPMSWKYLRTLYILFKNICIFNILQQPTTSVHCMLMQGTHEHAAEQCGQFPKAGIHQTCK
jgi:DNA-binding XRE family transcriptional regulator